jgi:hypothetical protein
MPMSDVIIRPTVRPLRRAIAALAVAAGVTVAPAVAAAAAPTGPRFPTAVPMPPAVFPSAVPAVAADPVSIDWKTLGALDYVNGKVPPALQALNGKEVKIPGFIVPLEDYEEEGAEFLLVPYFGACVHTPPPPPNQMVYVRMQGGKKLKFGWWDPVWMEGTLKIEHYDSPYGAVGFQLVGTKTSPYAPK